MSVNIFSSMVLQDLKGTCSVFLLHFFHQFVNLYLLHIKCSGSCYCVFWKAVLKRFMSEGFQAFCFAYYVGLLNWDISSVKKGIVHPKKKTLLNRNNSCTRSLALVLSPYNKSEWVLPLVWLRTFFKISLKQFCVLQKKESQIGLI